MEVNNTMQEYDLTQETVPESETQGEPAVELDLSSDAEGLEVLASEIEGTAEGFHVTDFKCVKCGLVHGHATDKHRASDAFALSHEEAAEMEFSPNCHCGYNEMAHRGDEYGISDGPTPSEAASTAPVPPRVEKQLRG